MKKILFVSFCFLSFISCKEKEDGDDKNAMKNSTKVELPSAVMYPVTPEPGNPENMVTVMNWNKAIISGNVDAAAAYTADSMKVILANGFEANLSKDSAIAFIKGWRNSMDSAKQPYTVIFAIDNKEDKTEWVMQWANETYYYKNGKTESENLHEVYKLDKGKVCEVHQYQQAVPKK